MANDKTLELKLIARDLMSAVIKDAQKSMHGLADAVKDSALSAAGAWPQFSASFTTTIDDLVSGVGVAKDVLGTLKQAWDFAKEGAENERIANSFQATADSVGVDAQRMADALNKAARGTVDDEAYMQTATRNMALGMATDLQSNVQLMELARSAAIKFGGSTEDAFEGMSTAIGNLQTRQLKQYGILVDSKEANEKYAKALGKTADQLTESEQRTALLNEAMLKSKDIFKAVADQQMTTAEKFTAFEVKVGNLADVAKETAVDAFTPYLDGLTFLETLTDSNATEADKLRTAYESLRSQGIDPNSASMELMRQKIEEADRAMQSIGMSTGEAALRENMAAAAKAQSARASVENATATQQSDAATKEYSNSLLYNVQKYQEQKVAAEQAAAAEAIHRSSIAESITANSNLAQSLKTSTNAQAIQTLAQAQLDTLKQAYADGTISQEGFYKATDQVLLRYDLATPKSLAMADAQRAINDAFLAGDMPLKDFVTSSEKIPTIAADGKTTLAELASLGVKPTTTAVKDQATAVGALKGMWDQVPRSVTTTYRIVTQGSIPQGGSSSTDRGRAVGGPVSAMGSYLVGEHGPEPFVPAVDGRVLSRRDAMDALSRNGNGGAAPMINVSIAATMTSDQNIEETAWRVSEIIGSRLRAYQ
jgi:hypothetical protein